MLKFMSNEIEHIKKGEVEYLKFRAIEKYENKINHCIKLRKGGVSSCIYESLNFRMTNDTSYNVNENVNIILKKIGINDKVVYKAKQTHTDRVLYISNENKSDYEILKYNNEEFDAYICDDKNIATIITTADCVPVIIYDPKNNAYSNIHSGWRGTVNNICVKSALLMNEKFKSKFEDMIVCIGPSIRKCCFSSREKCFMENFTSKFLYKNEYISFDMYDEELFYIDLQKIIKKEMINIGIKEKNIHDSNICTCCNSNDFFSCRASKKQGINDFGTFGTIVMLRD